MKKVFSLLFLALFAASAVNMEATPSRADLISEVDSCWAVLQQVMSDPATAVPPTVWAQAHAVLITNQFKGAFIFGVKGGYGVVLVKQPNGHWSVPVLVSANEISLGLQLGGKAVETVYIITDDATPRLLFKKRFNMGVDAKAVIGPLAAQAENDNRPLVVAPILVYSKTAGLYAGATFKAAEVSRNDEANYVLYNSGYGMPELLYSNWVTPPPDCQALTTYVTHLAAQ
jgi:lipid-binding SYLF domain-containing protein